MKDVLFFPAFPLRDALLDQVFRAIWHFFPARAHLGRLIFPYTGDDAALLDLGQIAAFAKPYLSRDFDPAIADLAPQMADHLHLCDVTEVASLDTDSLGGVVLWFSGDPAINEQASAFAAQAGVPLIEIDPQRVQQETLAAIKFAWSLIPEDNAMALVRSSAENFFARLPQWQGQPVSAYGSGPTFGQITDAGYPVKTRLNMVCNSAVTDTEVLDLLNPALLFCGDPVQHCGANRYAGDFRRALSEALIPEHRVLITQLGYVPYFRAVMPDVVHSRIIGIGNDRRPTFNVDLTQEYMTAATANVLTMLMLPVAFTIAKDVHILGCDGRPFADSTRPWTHADEEDYQSKMACTHRLHPAFWRRGHEAEFTSYCSDLAEIIEAAETQSAVRVSNITPTYIPALAKRYVRPENWRT